MKNFNDASINLSTLISGAAPFLTLFFLLNFLTTGREQNSCIMSRGKWVASSLCCRRLEVPDVKVWIEKLHFAHYVFLN